MTRGLRLNILAYKLLKQFFCHTPFGSGVKRILLMKVKAVFAAQVAYRPVRLDHDVERERSRHCISPDDIYFATVLL
jgi:hypothetical protein